VKYWDFWNEPDFNHFWPHASGADTVCQDPLPADPMRELGPEAMLVAPSPGSCCEPFLCAFLDYAVRHRLEVNVLAWHELRETQADLPQIEKHLREARAKFFFDPTRPATAAWRALNLQRIHINEYLGPEHNFHPGEAAAYLYYLERGGADATDARRQPRASWWAYRHYAELQGGRFDYYLYRIAANLLYEDELRRRADASGMAQLASGLQAAADSGYEESGAEVAQLREQLERALGGLTPKCRAVVILHRREQMTYDEIGAELGISSSMVNARSASA
jgi:RNA polymerase sigma factor (sigma-70 family)